MKTYAILLRGINVGGKNKVPMAELKKCLEDLGFSGVKTYIASGNVIVRSDLTRVRVKELVERALPSHFKLDSELIKVLVMSRAQLAAIIKRKPAGFGEAPETYLCDAIFLMDIKPDAAMKVFKPRDGVDRVWPGVGVIYSQRLAALRTKSRLNAVMGTEAYRAMTIRNWNTATKLLELLKAAEASLIRES
jgi:uncharacterized protein (DUF1697 family)